MKKLILVLSLITVLFLTGCSNNEIDNLQEDEMIGNTEVSGELENDFIDEDQRLFNDFVSKVKVVENRKDYYDESGDLLYYIQYDYLESNTDEANINKIVANYPKRELVLEEEFVGVRFYPEDVYYDSAKYSISSVHNGIINIKEVTDWWWGSAHSYPAFSCKNYVLETGDEYNFPSEIKEDIYNKGVEAFVKIAQENNYAGLLGYYYDSNEELTGYLEEDEETRERSIKDEELFRRHILDALQKDYFEVTDDKIIFYLNTGYDLSDWASRALYSVIEIQNEWDL